MVVSQSNRRKAYLAKTQAELASLAERGVVMSGNTFSSLLLVKGDLSPEERAGGELLAGADGRALRQAFAALGYAPENWTALSVLHADGSVMPLELFREAVAALGPTTLVVLDEVAADVVRSAYVNQLVEVEELDAALLKAGLVVRVLGMRVLNLGDFAKSLEDPQRKQWAWACLKRIPPLGEPY